MRSYQHHWLVSHDRLTRASLLIKELRLTIAILLAMLATLGVSFLAARSSSGTAARNRRTALTVNERVAYQRAIEEVYWRHRIWPAENSKIKPSLEAVMALSQIQARVEDYLRKSQALEIYWQRPITAEQLQAE